MPEVEDPRQTLRAFARLETNYLIERGFDNNEGAPIKYQVYGKSHGKWEICAALRFQDGPIAEPDGPNGLSNEVLLAICADRIEASQNVCLEDVGALHKIREALMWLNKLPCYDKYTK